MLRKVGIITFSERPDIDSSDAVYLEGVVSANLRVQNWKSHSEKTRAKVSVEYVRNRGVCCAVYTTAAEFSSSQNEKKFVIIMYGRVGQG